MSFEVKTPDVNGSFYPDDPEQLKNMINTFIDQGREFDLPPKAIIAPHAGYVYSGAVAGSAYKALKNIQEKVENIIILSPAHQHPFQGIATHSAEKFETPLGQINVNMEIINTIQAFPFINNLNDAFVKEHALEVHLPFIQTIFGNDKVKIVPMVVGPTDGNNIMKVLDSLWDDDMKNFIIVSSDLSHFNPYDEAKAIDLETKKAIENLKADDLSPEQVCGYYPIRGFIELAKKRKLTPHTLDMRNSGDTAGDRSGVVGYGAFIFT